MHARAEEKKPQQGMLYICMHPKGVFHNNTSVWSSAHGTENEVWLLKRAVTTTLHLPVLPTAINTT